MEHAIEGMLAPTPRTRPPRSVCRYPGREIPEIPSISVSGLGRPSRRTRFGPGGPSRRIRFGPACFTVRRTTRPWCRCTVSEWHNVSRPPRGIEWRCPAERLELHPSPRWAGAGGSRAEARGSLFCESRAAASFAGAGSSLGSYGRISAAVEPASRSWIAFMAENCKVQRFPCPGYFADMMRTRSSASSAAS